VRRSKIVFLTAIVIGLVSSVARSQVKWAQTGFNFLSVSSDARAGAMGDAVNSLSGYSGALSHNPASMAEMPSLLGATFSVNSWIADIKYKSTSLMISPVSGDYGVLGISWQYVDYGEVQGTRVASNEKGYEDIEIMSPTAYAVGVGYAKTISDRFAVGAQVRFAHQALGESAVPAGTDTVTKENVASALAYDFGTVFKTGIKSLAFGMSVRNFSREVKYEEEGFQLPLLFTLGISANVFDFFQVPGPEQSLLLSVDATHPRSHPEQIKIGVEYRFMDLLALRGGYLSGDSEDDFTFGLGVSSRGLGISSINFEVDYSYTPFGVFNNVQRFTTRLSL
jgi:hypothetical protein